VQNWIHFICKVILKSPYYPILQQFSNHLSHQTQQERKEAVLEWIQSGCNYDQGVLLYSQFGKNKFLIKDFNGKQHKYSTKIIYELCKSASLDYAQLQSEKLIPVLQETPIKQLPSTDSSVQPNTHVEVSGGLIILTL